MTKKRANGDGSFQTTTRNGKPYYRGVVVVGYTEEGQPIRKTVNGANRADVMKRFRALQVAADEGRLLQGGGDIPFARYFKEWVDTIKAPTIRYNTLKNYTYIADELIEKHPIGTIPLQKLSARILQQHIKRLQAQGVGLTSIASCVTRIKSCLAYAVRVKDLFENPAQYLVAPKYDRPPRIYVYTREEQERLLASLEDTHEDRLIYLLFVTGLRIGEALGLRWSDYTGDAIVPTQQSTAYGLDGPSTLGPLKTSASYRTIPIGDKTRAILEKQRAYALCTRLAAGSTWEDHDLIFPSPTGTPLHQSRIRYFLQKRTVACGVPTFGPHAIRHSFATRLFEEGVPLKTVQTLLGHSNIAMTANIYTSVFEEQKKEAIEKLEKIL